MLLGPRTALGAAYPFACVTSFSTTRSSSFPHPHSVPAAARRRPTRRGDAVFGGKPPAASSNPRRRRRRQVLQPGRTQVLETPRRPAFKMSASFFFAATKCFFAGTSFKFCYQVFGFLFGVNQFFLLPCFFPCWNQCIFCYNCLQFLVELIFFFASMSFLAGTIVSLLLQTF